jgi:hypothetical protein
MLKLFNEFKLNLRQVVKMFNSVLIFKKKIFVYRVFLSFFFFKSFIFNIPYFKNDKKLLNHPDMITI